MLAGQLAREGQDAYVDQSNTNIRSDAGDVLIRGHCDERGSAEYNQGLTARRANSAKELLLQPGVTGRVHWERTVASLSLRDG